MSRHRQTVRHICQRTQSMKEVKKLGCEVGQGQGRVTAAPVLCPSPSSRRFSWVHSTRACVVAIPRMSSMDHNAISLVLFTPQRSLVVLASSVERRHSFHYHLTYYQCMDCDLRSCRQSTCSCRLRTVLMLTGECIVIM